MASGRALLLALLLALCVVSALGRTPSWDGKIVMPTEEKEKDEEGTRWAILIAGSAGYWNYRHQVPTYSTIMFKILHVIISTLKSSSLAHYRSVVCDSDIGIIFCFWDVD